MFLLLLKEGILNRDAIMVVMFIELVSSALQTISAAFYGMIDEIINQTH